MAGTTVVAPIWRRKSECLTEETPLHEIAKLLEKHHIKRVPVVRDKKLVGIISRANLLHELVTAGAGRTDPSSFDDQTIRDSLMKTLSEEAHLSIAWINATVRDGVVQLWGLVYEIGEREAAQVAAENTPGVKSVENHLGHIPRWAWT